MVTAFLAFGSNLGNRLAIFQGARAVLRRTAGLRITAISPLYETTPVGGPPGQGDYLNAVLRIATAQPARDLLRLCLAVEGQFGRERKETWGARTLDIDLLLYGDEIHRETDLMIPHPQMHLRPFVLLPLMALAPDLLHPQLEQTPRQLLARFPTTQGVRRLAEKW